LQRVEDIERLEVPDPHTSGLCPKCLDYYKWMKQHTDAEFRRKYGYLEGWAFYVGGPFDIACLLRGVTNFMKDLYLHPKLAQKLLDVATEWIIAWLEVQQEEVVGDIRLLAISDDNSGNISKPFFEKFALPCFRTIFDKFSKVPYRQFHNDAPNVKHILDKIPEIGANVFLAFTPNIDISVFKRFLGKRMCLIGNLDPLNVLLRGTSQQVLAESRRQIEIAASGSGFCLASGGAVARETPSQNISAMIEAAKTYGKYPMNSTAA